MSTIFKEIQISTVESRFKKLYNAANFAKDNCMAIAFHVNELQPFNITKEQAVIIKNLQFDIDRWCGKFVRLVSQMNDIEADYRKHLNKDKSKCSLIEDIPTYNKSEIPNVFQMTEKLFEIGYYSIDGIPKTGHVFTKEKILSNIKDLRSNIILCIKALAGASYKGVWQDVEKTIFDIYEFEPDNNISQLLESYDIDD